MIKHPAATLLDELPDEVMLHAFRDLQVLPTPSGHSLPSPTWGYKPPSPPGQIEDPIHLLCTLHCV